MPKKKDYKKIYKKYHSSRKAKTERNMRNQARKGGISNQFATYEWSSI